MDAADVVQALVSRLPRAIVRLDELDVSQDALSEAVASGAVEVWLGLSSAILAQAEAAKRGLQLYAPDKSRPGDLAALVWYARPPRERVKSIQLDDYTDPPAPEVEPPDEDEIQAWCDRPKRRGWQEWQDRRDKSTLRPSHILDVPCWSPAIEKPPNGQPCAVCGSRELGLLVYCAGCTRSGLDRWLPRPRPLPRSSYRPDPRLKGGVG